MTPSISIHHLLNDLRDMREITLSHQSLLQDPAKMYVFVWVAYISLTHPDGESSTGSLLHELDPPTPVGFYRRKK